MNIFTNCIIVLFITTQLLAQYYHFPMDNFYGISSTFGDMRRRHLHFGLDLRTQETINKPIFASEDGYVYRIFVADYGYGKAIYLKHPDGNMTVYAHVDRFAPEIEKFVYSKQLERKKFKLNIYLKSNQFPVKKGQLIAYSGNTGGSSGPHLHYEVRDKRENIIQPLKFLDLEDNLPPYFTRIAIQPLSENSRINNKFEKLIIFPDKYKGEVIRVSGPFGIEITAYDKFPKSKPFLGIYSAKLFLDNELIFHFSMDTFAFWQADYIPASIDFKFYQKSNGIYLRKLYIDNKNLLPIYKFHKNKGIINITDSREHIIKVVISDYHQNKKEFSFKVKNDNVIPVDNNTPIYGPNIPVARFVNYYTEKKHLIIKTQGEISSILLHFKDGIPPEIVNNYYQKGSYKFFMWKFDINCIPDFATLQYNDVSDTIQFNFLGYALPNREKTFQISKDIKVYIPRTALVDTILFEFKKDKKGNIFIHNTYDPVVKPITICVKPPENSNKYVLVEIEPDGEWDYVDNHYYSNGYCCAPAKQFGKYIIYKDEKPPKITPLNLYKYKQLDRSKDCLYFSIKDIGSEVRSSSVQAYAEGRWILTEFYDYQKIIRIPLRYLPENAKTLLITASDNAGNWVKKKFTLP